MHTLGACLIEQQLYKIRAATPSLSAFYSAIQLLSKILSNLLKFSSDHTSLIIAKDDKFFKESLSLPEIQELLKLLGYQEEKDQFVFKISDENCMKTEGCLCLLQDFYKERSPSSLPEVPEYQGREDSSNSRQSKSLNDLEERRKLSRKECCEGDVKASLLLRHLKKEENSNVMIPHLRHVMDQKRRSSSYTFDVNGYFHQSSSKRDSKDKKNYLIKDLFHHQQEAGSKKWGRAGFDLN